MARAVAGNGRQAEIVSGSSTAAAPRQFEIITLSLAEAGRGVRRVGREGR